jgi:hypothetical protein
MRRARFFGGMSLRPPDSRATLLDARRRSARLQLKRFLPNKET